MRNKEKRDWFCVIILPVFLFFVSSLLSKWEYNYAAGGLWGSFYVFVITPYLFLTIASILLARMVSISKEVYQSKWILVVVGVQSVVLLFVVVLPRLGILPIPSGLAFVGQISTTGFCLFGAFLFMLCKAAFIQKSKIDKLYKGG